MAAWYLTIGAREKAACCLAGPLCADKEGELDGNLRGKVEQVTERSDELQPIVELVTA
jgi:hypothetical protein